MGDNWQVYEHVYVEGEGYQGYQYILSYSGGSLLMALLDMIRCKRNGAGCVKIEWRG